MDEFGWGVSVDLMVVSGKVPEICYIRFSTCRACYPKIAARALASLARNELTTLRFFPSFGGQLGVNISLFRSNSKLALPYI